MKETANIAKKEVFLPLSDFFCFIYLCFVNFRGGFLFSILIEIYNIFVKILVLKGNELFYYGTNVFGDTFNRSSLTLYLTNLELYSQTLETKSYLFIYLPFTHGTCSIVKRNC